MKPVRKSTGNSNTTNGRGWGSNGAAGFSKDEASLSLVASTSDVPLHRRPRAVNLASPPTTIEVRGIPIHFPFQPYKCQEDYMGVVLDALLRQENALLESPTGTGKTLCLLCACLAWQRQHARMLQSQTDIKLPPETETKPFNKVPTIIYASRTHSQLSQVVRELRNTRYRPKHAVLGSREQMCVNPKVKKATATATTINHDCSILNKERKCNFRNRLEGFTAPSNESQGGTQPVMDMEDLVLMGNKNRVCPFYYTRSLVEDAELVLVPYNYLFDKDSRTSTLADIPWKNAVLIFDEAHNLESFASESASFDLSSKDIGGCMNEVDKAITYIESDPDRFGGYIKRDNLLQLKAIFMKLEEYILTKLPVNATAYRGEKMMDIFHKGANISFANYTLIVELIKKLMDIFMEIRGGNSKGAPRLEHFVQCLKRVFGEVSEARCLAKAESYRVHVSPPHSGASSDGYRGGNEGFTGRTVSYWCFAPSEAMRELQELQVRSILVTSGTLSPLESYAIELDLPFPNRLENPHIISSDQIHVRIIGKGVSNKLLNSSYERRQNAEYYIELGNTLASLSRIIPGGMLIFFPSYGVMETAIERWGGPTSSNARNETSGVHNFFAKRQRNVSGPGRNAARYSFPQQALDLIPSSTGSSPWKRLLSNKAVIIEPKLSSDLPDAIEEFHKHLNQPKSKGVALFGVCRGKISEGIDFAHDMCRAVIITGLPFAPSFDPKVKMKREFLDQNRAKQYAKASTDGGFGTRLKSANSSLSGHEWYQQQAHRAVNQAIGRVIRNKQDYGAVLLLDSRFELPGNQNGLSKWVRPHVLADEGFGRANHALVQFYKKAKAFAAKPALQAPPSNNNPTKVSRILDYEYEGKENNQTDGETLVNETEYTKVAFIDRTRNNSEGNALDAHIQSESSPSKSYIPPHSIIATVDVTTREGSKTASEVLKGEVQNNGISSLSWSSSQSTQHSPRASENKDPLITPSLKAAEPGEQKQPPETPARRFFQIVQVTMSAEEVGLIKKAVVQMKKYARLKDQKDFVAAAREVIRTILKYDQMDNKKKDEKPEILVLFLQLLPKHFIDAGYQCTLDLVFRDSKLREELKGSIPQHEYSKLHMDFVSFLTNLWFDDGRLDERKTATQLSELVMPLINSGTLKTSSLSEGIQPLIPREAHRVINAFISEVADSIAQPRGNEKDRNTIPSRDLKMQNLNRSLRNPTVEASPAMTSSQEISVSTNRTMRMLQNPYNRNPNAAKKSHIAGTTLTGTLGSLLETKKRDLEESTAASSLNKILKHSASEVFTGNYKRRTISDFSSNSPKDLNCTICDRHMEQPFISECGHMACFSCWDLWLRKTGTCAHCRKPVDPKSLALAVFKGEQTKSGL